MRRYLVIVISIFFLLLFIGSPLRRVYAPYRYRELVKYYSEKYGLDWLLVTSIIFHESRFRYWAESKKGARGLMQIMPETGFEIAKKLGWEDFSSDNLFKPRINLEMGCFYFNELLRLFNNDIRIALAAYNSGKGSIYRYYSMNKQNLSYPASGSPGLSYPDIQKYLYPETKKYVGRVNSTYRMLRLLNRVWRF